MSASKRLTPGRTTAGVLYTVAIGMLVSAFVLTVMAPDNIVISTPWHFGFILLSLLASGIFSTLGSAARDGLFVFPKDGPVDPAPYQFLPSIEWQNSDDAMQINLYLISIVFAFAAVILTFTPGGDSPHILFTEGFHFFVWTTFVVLSAGFLLLGAVVEDHGARKAKIRARWIISSVAAVMAFVSAVMAPDHIILFPEFHLGFFLTALTVSAIACYSAGRLSDRYSSGQEQTTTNLFIIAGVLAATAAITAMVAGNTIIFSAGFHLGLIVMFGILAACVAIYGALLRDRDNG